MFLFCLVFAMFCARLFICALWSPAGKGLTSWLSFVVSTGILGQVWYLIVSIPDLCTLTYLRNIDNPYFDQMVGQIYPTELQLNKANSSDSSVFGPEHVNNKWHSFF